jgi:PIN domain nuclease of toxin-antitoxin system
MRLLLDSNVMLWWAGLDACKLSDAAASAIADADTVMVSFASVWELEIKRSIGKLVFPFDDWDAVTARGAGLLPITLEHIQIATRLPLLHKDPFDRMLVAQAICEDLVLLSSDRRLRGYGGPVIEA